MTADPDAALREGLKQAIAEHVHNVPVLYGDASEDYIGGITEAADAVLAYLREQGRLLPELPERWCSLEFNKRNEGILADLWFLPDGEWKITDSASGQGDDIYTSLAAAIANALGEADHDE